MPTLMDDVKRALTDVRQAVHDLSNITMEQATEGLDTTLNTLEAMEPAFEGPERKPDRNTQRRRRSRRSHEPGETTTTPGTVRAPQPGGRTHAPSNRHGGQTPTASPHVTGPGTQAGRDPRKQAEEDEKIIDPMIGDIGLAGETSPETDEKIVVMQNPTLARLQDHTFQQDRQVGDTDEQKQHYDASGTRTEVSRDHNHDNKFLAEALKALRGGRDEHEDNTPEPDDDQPAVKRPTPDAPQPGRRRRSRNARLA